MLSPEEEVQDTYAVRRAWERMPLPRGSSRGGAAVGPGLHQRPLQKDLAQLGWIHPRPGDNLRHRIDRQEPGIPHGLEFGFRLFRGREKNRGRQGPPARFRPRLRLPHVDKPGSSCHGSSALAATRHRARAAALRAGRRGRQPLDLHPRGPLCSIASCRAAA